MHTLLDSSIIKSIVRLLRSMSAYILEGVRDRGDSRRFAIDNTNIFLEGVRDRGASRKAAVVNACMYC